MITDSRGINLTARTAAILQILLTEKEREKEKETPETYSTSGARHLFTGDDKSAHFLPMSERRTSVRVRRNCRSIDSRGKRVSAVNVPACSRRAAIRRIRARGMIYGKTRKSARGLYGSCLDSRVAPATSSIAPAFTSHVCSSLYYFYAALRALLRTLRIRHIIAVAHDLHIVPRVAI